MKKLLIITTICIVLVSCNRPADNSTQNADVSPKVDSSISDFKKETMEMMQGTWVHMEDSLAVVEIKGDDWIFKYVGDEVADYDSFNIQLTDTMTSYLKKDYQTLFLLLTNKSNEMDYEILTLTDDIMDLMYYPRGNTLTYERVK